LYGAKGDFGGIPYNATWYIKEGKWCERWSSTGAGCWDLERVDETHIRVYENGIPEKNLWEIQ
jgi:hypothetical protein